MSALVQCPLMWRVRFIKQWRMLGYASWPSHIVRLYGNCSLYQVFRFWKTVFLVVRKSSNIAKINPCSINSCFFPCSTLESSQELSYMYECLDWVLWLPNPLVVNLKDMNLHIFRSNCLLIKSLDGGPIPHPTKLNLQLTFDM